MIKKSSGGFFTITSGENRWEFNSWDRFLVPKPFSRVILRFGQAIHVPDEMDEEAFEATRLEVEKRLKDLYDDTDRIWDSPDRIRAIYE